MNKEQIKIEATANLLSSQSALTNLHKAFGDTISIDMEVTISAANLAQMSKIIEEYSEMQLSILKMLNAKTITLGGLDLDEFNAEIFKLGMSTALELAGNARV